MVKITDVTGIGPATAKVLFEHKIKTVEALASISFDELKKIPGFSDLRARAVKKAAADCLLKPAKPSAISAKSVQAPIKTTSAKKTTKTVPVAQQIAEPVAVPKAERRKK